MKPGIANLSQEAAFAIDQGAIHLAGGCALVAIDPGSTICGWAVRIRPIASSVFSIPSVIFDHGQEGSVADACRNALHVCGTRPIGLLVVEEPVVVAVGNQWKLAWAGGEARGRLAEQQVDERCTWLPKQSTWRAVRGFNRGLARAEGETVNGRIHEWAEALVHSTLRTSTGGPEIDRANAIAILDAAEQLILQRHNPIETKKKAGTKR